MEEIRRKRYSLIVPVYNAADRLREVLAPLLALGPEWEVILIDDASQDGSRDVIGAYPFRLLPMPSQSGQSAARNLGIAHSEGEILVFLDSDVVVEAQTLVELAVFLESRSDLEGVFGCYSPVGTPGEPAVSRFRNLLHRYVHQCSEGAVGTFWAGLGALRRRSLNLCGGFDSRLDGIEDVELGTRISRAGGKLWLQPDFQGRHLKRWSFSSMLYTDVHVRAAQWSYYSWLGVTPRKGLNLSPRFAIPPMLLLLACLVLPWQAGLAGPLALLYFVANLWTYRYFLEAGGARVGLLSPVFLAVHHGSCLSGALLGTLRFGLRRLSLTPPHGNHPRY